MKRLRWGLVSLILTASATDVAATPQPGLDVDGDRIISREEFQAFRRARAFSHDANEDGRLALEEFRAFLPERVPGFMHGRIFSRMDTDGDDFVSPQELDAAPARAFDDADADGDGQLMGAEVAALRTAMRADE